jgi:hypothetical protein
MARGHSQSARKPNETDAMSSSNESIFGDIFETLTYAKCRSAVMLPTSVIVPAIAAIRHWVSRPREFAAAPRPDQVYRTGQSRTFT